MWDLLGNLACDCDFGIFALDCDFGICFGFWDLWDRFREFIWNLGLWDLVGILEFVWDFGICLAFWDLFGITYRPIYF